MSFYQQELKCCTSNVKPTSFDSLHIHAWKYTTTGRQLIEKLARKKFFSPKKADQNKQKNSVRMQWKCRVVYWAKISSTGANPQIHSPSPPFALPILVWQTRGRSTTLKPLGSHTSSISLWGTGTEVGAYYRTETPNHLTTQETAPTFSTQHILIRAFNRVYA